MNKLDYSAEATVLLKTAHGSTLYGMAHANSDHDTYIVTGGLGKFARQTIMKREDATVVSYEKFVAMLMSGVPQALEALFSPLAEVNQLTHLRDALTVNRYEIVHTYMRTVKSFALSTQGDAYGIMKRRRHALRLASNLNSFVTTGAFTPVLTPELAEEFTRVANLPFEEYLAYLDSYVLLKPSEDYLTPNEA